MTYSHILSFFSRSESRTIGLVFAINSFLFGNWVTRIPSVKANLQLNESELGLALLGLPIGALTIMPISGWIISKLSTDQALKLGLLVFASLSWLPAFSSSLIELIIALYFYGLSNAFLDITMNANASIIEKNLNTPIMSTCHGMWSFGAMVGSVTGSIFLGSSISVEIHLFSIAVFSLCAVLWLTTKLNSSNDPTSPSSSPLFAFPERSVLIFAVIGFCILLSEGAIADWSSIYMKETLKSSPFLIGIAYAGYSMFMAIGRFSGDGLIPRFGNRKILYWGSVLSFSGLMIALSFGLPLAGIIGFSLTGLGFSCVVPIVFSESAKKSTNSPGVGIASVATMGYTGFLIGPPFIGFVAEIISLRAALYLIVVLSAIVAILSTRIK